eukprot:maker-scaffold_53-snap-gene-0.37-mRNA-1 protein AED:0.02 eAED:0.02 QI:64/1/1/1/1/1/2/65/206
MSYEATKYKRWTEEEDKLLREAIKTCGGPNNWKKVASFIPSRSYSQCFHRWIKVLKPGLVKGFWTPEEDQIILQAVAEGEEKWTRIATRIPGRLGKQCRERYFNHLAPYIKKEPWTQEEISFLIEEQGKLGNKWAYISRKLKGRTENDVKNKWNTLKYKRKSNQRKSRVSNRKRVKLSCSQELNPALRIDQEVVAAAKLLLKLTNT